MEQTLLLVEDEALIAMTEAQMLKNHGYEVLTAYSAKKAIETVEESNIDLILMDIDLGKGKMSGTEAAEIILKDHDIPVVFLSSHTEAETVEKTEEITSYGYIVKNSGNTVILASIKMTFRLYDAHMELKRQKENLQNALIQQEKSKEELQVYTERYQQLFKNISSCVAVYEPIENGENLVLVDFNKSAEKTDKISKEEVIGKKVTEVFPAVREFGLFEVFQRVAKYGEPEHLPAAQYKDERIVGWRDNYVYKLPSGEVVAVYEDLTEQKRLEKTLKENEKNLRITLNSIGDAVLSTDTTGNVISMNPVAEKLTGWEIDSAKGKNLNEVFHIIHADTRDIVDNPVEKVLQNGEIVGLANHTVLISKNGQEFQISDSAAPIKDDDGNINGVVLVFRDVTEQYEKDEKLRESEKKYRLLFENMMDGFAYHKIVTDENGKAIDYIFMEINNAFGKLTGLKREKIIGKKVTEALPGIEKDPANWIGKYGEVALTGKELRYEEYSEPLDRWYSVYTFCPKKGYFATLFEDITERKQAEEALKESEQKLSSILNNMTDVVWSISWPNLRHEYLSPSLEKLYGRSEQEFMDNPTLFKEVTHPDDQHLTEKAMKQLMEDGEATRECRIIKPDGSIVWINDRSKMIYDENHKPIKIAGVTRNITERKQAEEQLQKALEEKDFLMKELNHRVKNNLAMVSSLINLRSDVDLSDLANQVNAIGKIHDGLLMHNSGTSIRFRDYLESLLNNVFYSCSVTSEIDIEDIEISPKVATTVGLVVNELATNTVKYGISQDKDPKFKIVMKHENSCCNLFISNNGPPLPDDFSNTNSLGIHLVISLVEQLEGEINITKTPHPHFEITFPCERNNVKIL